MALWNKQIIQESDYFYVRRTLVILWTVVFSLGGIYILWLLRGVLSVVFMGFLIASFLNRIIEKLYSLRGLNNLRGGRGGKIAVFFIFYLLLVLTFVQAGYILINESIVFVKEIGRLQQMLSFEDTFGFLPRPVYESIKAGVLTFIQRLVDINITFSGAKFVANMMPILVLLVFSSWYFLLDSNRLIEVAFGAFFNAEAVNKIKNVYQKLQVEIGKWAEGQLLLMVLVGVLTYIGLWLLDMPYGFVLAFLAGLLEIIPNFGPIIASVPAILLGLLKGGVSQMMWVTVLYYAIQQLENSLFVPRIMGSKIGVHPFFVILAVIVGQTLFGSIGGILAVPLYVLITTLLVIVSGRKA